MRHFKTRQDYVSEIKSFCYLNLIFCKFYFLDFALNYCVNGELLSFINQQEVFDEEATLFYMAEILLALEHLHRLGIVHR